MKCCQLLHLVMSLYISSGSSLATSSNIYVDHNEQSHTSLLRYNDIVQLGKLHCITTPSSFIVSTAGCDILSYRLHTGTGYALMISLLALKLKYWLSVF